MKHTILILLSAFVIINASASYVQTYCSNGEGTIQMSEGHRENQVLLTNRSWVGDDLVDTSVVTENFDMNISVSDENTLEKINELVCHPGASEGYGMSQITATKKVKLSKKDGSLFSEDIVGVSDDLKTVEAIVICEKNGAYDSLQCP